MTVAQTWTHGRSKSWPTDGQASSRRTGCQRTCSSTKLGGNHNATLRTLDVLYVLLVVEGQGAHPRATGIRKQVWVCRADAGVEHAWKAAGKVSKAEAAVFVDFPPLLAPAAVLRTQSAPFLPLGIRVGAKVCARVCCWARRGPGPSKKNIKLAFMSSECASSSV